MVTLLVHQAKDDEATFINVLVVLQVQDLRYNCRLSTVHVFMLSGFSF